MSNNVAEYAGVLQVLKYLAPRPPGRVTIHGDSKLVINQLNGKWRIRKGLYRSIAVDAKDLLAHLHGAGGRLPVAGFHVPKMRNATPYRRKQTTGQIRHAGTCRRGRTHMMP